VVIIQLTGELKYKYTNISIIRIVKFVIFELTIPEFIKLGLLITRDI